MKDFKEQEIKVGDVVIFSIGGHLRESVIEILDDPFVKVKRIKRHLHKSHIFKI